MSWRKYASGWILDNFENVETLNILELTVLKHKELCTGSFLEDIHTFIWNVLCHYDMCSWLQVTFWTNRFLFVHSIFLTVSHTLQKGSLGFVSVYLQRSFLRHFLLSLHLFWEFLPSFNEGGSSSVFRLRGKVITHLSRIHSTQSFRMRATFIAFSSSVLFFRVKAITPNRYVHNHTGCVNLYITF